MFRTLLVHYQEYIRCCIKQLLNVGLLVYVEKLFVIFSVVKDERRRIYSQMMDQSGPKYVGMWCAFEYTVVNL
jgi:hypothetical protein